jgi:hypothetical protein
LAFVERETVTKLALCGRYWLLLKQRVWKNQKQTKIFFRKKKKRNLKDGQA